MHRLNAPEFVEFDDIRHEFILRGAVGQAAHGDHDELAVERALRCDAGYVGLVASRKRAET